MASKITILAFALASGAMAQLLNCAEVPQCPMSNTLSQCRVDGSLVTAIGVANFSSTLSQFPLTWTVTYGQNLSNLDLDERTYYLGYPPELDMPNLPSVSSCALFFTGIEAGLSFLKPEDEREEGPTPGTCGDALGTTCVADLMQQAQDLVASNPDCVSLAQMLQAAPPSSCTEAGSWGNIVAMSLNQSTPAQITNCHPTSNSTYKLSSVAVFPELFDHDYFNDVTPLMTVFMPKANGTGDSSVTNFTTPEIHLNCMKPLNVEGTPTITPSGTASSSGIATVLVSLVVGLQVLLWLS